ncbi:hypothetical protein D9615_004237 [Tricholomella constricta]|uniref:Uncharacterized protein n=1 Tax=Tricholomella constricta TaxID=117010 RepID=A0A8H5HF03_9AGAR|nr:hypothetical protein D9615_004237 [Tricholomella constricta]
MHLVRRITRRSRSREDRKNALLDPAVYPAPQPGEDFTPVRLHEVSPPDLKDVVGGGESFTNYRVEWYERIVTMQQFHGTLARQSFEEHFAVLCLLRDSSVPVRWVAGVSSGSPEDDPFILYNAYSIWDDLRPLVRVSLETYIEIPKEKRAGDYEVWLRADNIENFFRHLGRAEFQEILSPTANRATKTQWLGGFGS